jgi:hypothetical protein
MNEKYYPIKKTYNSLAKADTYHRIESMLYEPVEPNEKSQIAVILIHPGNNSLERPGSIALAERGYRALSASVIDPNGPLDQKLLDVKVTVEYLRQYPGVEKVILLGHSGGATLMSAYQKIAEHGVQALQGPEKLIKCSDLGKFPPADGIMHLDSNYGNGIMTLFSLDPAVMDEDNGKKLNPEFDLFDPANGYNPNGSTYSKEFIRKYQQAQGERNNRLINAAVERLKAIESGKGKFIDDEPFIVPAGTLNGYNNKLLPQDTRLLSRTQKAWPLVHADGSITNQIIPCVRRAKNKQSFSNSYRLGAIKSTVRVYLNSFAVRTTEDYGYTEDSLYGIEWSSSYNCTPGNMMDVSAPLLVMGMTGGYEFLAAEIIYEMANKVKDKTIAFVEGATHVFNTAKDCEEYPGQYGDTMETLFNYVDSWLFEKGRFID